MDSIQGEKLTLDCRAWYEEMAFHRVYQALYNFATVELSSLYFDILKDRLYTSARKSEEIGRAAWRERV